MEKELIIIMIKYGGVSDIKDLLKDSFKIRKEAFNAHRFLYNKTILTSQDFDSTITSKEVLLIKDYQDDVYGGSFFNEVSKKVNGYVFSFDLVKVWFHHGSNGNQKQKKIFDEHFKELDYDWEEGRHSYTNIYGEEDLIALLGVLNLEGWNSVFDKMSSRFFNHDLEEKIINVINDSKDANLNVLRNYIKNNKS